MGKAERRAANELVAAYHEARLTELVEHVSTAVDRHRANEIDAYSVDELIHHYHRATQELGKFCWSGSDVEFIAGLIERMAADRQEPIDWWDRGAARNRRRRES